MLTGRRWLGDLLDIALAHDYITQRGGAERVVLEMANAFPGAPVYTTLYHPERTFPEFRDLDVRPSRLNRWSPLRRDHRAALPLLARDVDRIRIEADVVLASSSGWAHGMRTSGRKVVYCHAPARWLYQTDRYASGSRTSSRGSRPSVRATATRAAVAVLGARLREWDRVAALSADRYLVNSTTIQRAVREAYGIEAEVVPPPPALLPSGAESEVPGIEPGYFLVVARLLPYKNIDIVIEAAKALGARLVVVGVGPDWARLERIADRTVTFTGTVDDAQLRWLYRNAAALVAAAFEDYGLAPLEAAAFGRPAVALHDGGFLDTVVDGVTGTFFPQAAPADIAAAMERSAAISWDGARITEHAGSFSADRFAARLRDAVS